MDVSSTTQSSRMRLPDKMAFYSSEDDRLTWLEDDFLLYLQDWKRSSRARQFLSRETYEATVLTTKCTRALIKYLLDVKSFHFVLTRPLQSDKVESFFSSVRQLNGSNYNVAAKEAFSAIEKMNRTGMAMAALSGNVRLERVQNQVNPKFKMIKSVIIEM